MSDENIDESCSDNQTTQRTGRFLIDERSFKYKIDYVCKTNPKVFWRCFHDKCSARIYTIGFQYPIYYINQNHNHLPNMKHIRDETKSNYQARHREPREPVLIKKKNIIYHFRA